MTASDFTIALFCRIIDDVLHDQKKHSLAELYPSEVVTLGMLHALRGEGPCAFYRWVQKELAELFPRLPERTRLFRLLVQFEGLCERFLAQPTFFGVADSYGIELVHPWREKRAQREVARKGLSNHRCGCPVGGWEPSSRLSPTMTDEWCALMWPAPTCMTLPFTR